MFPLIHVLAVSDFTVLAFMLAGLASLVLAVKDFVAALRPVIDSARTHARGNLK